MALIYTLLDESVSPQDVISSLNNKQGVVITYSDENSSAPDKRYIEPYVYGRTKAGNDAIRAYQYYGDTKRGVPKWKMFRLDRITSWNPTSQHFNAEPKERGWNAESYNENRDGSMVQVLNQVNISSDGKGAIFAAMGANAEAVHGRIVARFDGWQQQTALPIGAKRNG